MSVVLLSGINSAPRDGILWWDFDQHMHMIRHQVSFNVIFTVISEVRYAHTHSLTGWLIIVFMDEILNFSHCIENLKSTLRNNKTRSGRQESTAEHSWRLALLAFIICDDLKLKIDILHSVKMALVHDLAEAITGDIDALKVAQGYISKDQKSKNERNAMRKLQAMCSKKIGQEIFEIWNEYEQGITLESKYIKALDKIETIMQIVEAKHKYFSVPHFISTYADAAVSNFPALFSLLKKIKKELRNEYNRVGLEWKPEYD